jgi:hypothetical protein
MLIPKKMPGHGVIGLPFGKRFMQDLLLNAVVQLKLIAGGISIGN